MEEITIQKFKEVLTGLENGSIRVAEQDENGEWKVNT